jgi:hypothetical protein
VLIEGNIVREHLEKILSSSPFRASKRCQDFLRFVVTRSLDGQNEFLKERIIGAEVFGRGPGYEPSEDAIVRVKANEVRKRLAQYYMETGALDSVRIEMPSGSYIPDFRLLASTPPSAPELPIPSPKSTKFRRYRLSLLAAIPLVLAAIVWAIVPGPTALDLFWAPVINHSNLTMLCTGNSLSYTLSSRIQMEYFRRHPEAVDAVSTPLSISPDFQIEAQDIVPVRGEQLSVGMFYAALDVAALMQKKGKQIQVRAGCDLATDDLSEHSLILLGGFSNPWTMEFSKDLRFTLRRELTPDGVISKVVDSESKEPAKWSLSNSFAFGRTTHDFAVITRVIHRDSRNVMISAAGLTRFGTQIAAEFITNPVYWNEAMKSAPRGWEKKNLQIVLETDVVGKTPNAPHVLAMHFW